MRLADRAAQIVERLLRVATPGHRHEHRRAVRRAERVADDLTGDCTSGGVPAAHIHDAAMRDRPAALPGPGVDTEAVPAAAMAGRPPRLRAVDPRLDLVRQERMRRIEDVEEL